MWVLFCFVNLMVFVILVYPITCMFDGLVVNYGFIATLVAF
jgi:hypothetical protein